MRPQKVPLDFYYQDTEIVARQLIGKVLVRQLNTGEKLRCRISETEAYLGLEDRAAHTFGGRRTNRTEVMWGPGGNAYIYFIYGMYFCLNAVTRPTGIPEAVLIRAAIPLENSKAQKIWDKLEPSRAKRNRIFSGPGKLCQGFAIDKSLNGVSLRGNTLWIEEGIEVPNSQVVQVPRVGIDYAKGHPSGAHSWPLRYIWSHSPSFKKQFLALLDRD